MMLYSALKMGCSTLSNDKQCGTVTVGCKFMHVSAGKTHPAGCVLPAETCMRGYEYTTPHANESD